MSASQNKSKSAGLRFLWIPGRKRHNHKGRYDTTNKQLDYSSKQKRNEQWSLGGNKGQEKLIDAEIPGHSEGTSGILNSLPATTTIAAGASATAMKFEETNRFSILEDKNEKDMSTDSDLLKSNESIGDDKTDRVDTSQMSDKKDSNHITSKDRINSIESLQDKKLKDSSFDMTDSSSMCLNKYENGKKKNKKKKKKNKNDNNDTEDDPDAKTVKCLYYTLMCCECTIS